MKFKFFIKVSALLAFGLVVLFIIDPLDPSTVSTPFLLGIILMGLSLRQSTALVAVTSVLYSILTVYALITFHQYHQAHDNYVSPHPNFWLFQRMGLFLVLCGLAIYLAYYRTSTQYILSNVQNILAKLPIPVVISNAVGQIVYVNDALGVIFNKNPNELTGGRYVDFFMSQIEEGKAIRYYTEVFEDTENVVNDFEVTPFNSKIRVTARLTCLNSGSNRVMITVINLVQTP